MLGLLVLCSLIEVVVSSGFGECGIKNVGSSGLFAISALCPLIWTKIQESQDAQIRSADDRVDWLFVRPS